MADLTALPTPLPHNHVRLAYCKKLDTYHDLDFARNTMAPEDWVEEQVKIPGKKAPWDGSETHWNGHYKGCSRLACLDAGL